MAKRVRDGGKEQYWRQVLARAEKGTYRQTR
jgi:hypothetical protein